LEDAGWFCAGSHDAKVRNVKAKRVQVDEIWSFTAAKQKNVAKMKTRDKACELGIEGRLLHVCCWSLSSCFTDLYSG
jgi:hypothetical protein